MTEKAAPVGQLELIERLRGLLRPESAEEEIAVREVSMFGGRSFMVNDRLLVSALRTGDLLVRVDPTRYDELIARGAAQAEMGAGRSMGPGWLAVSADAVTDDEELAFWLQAASQWAALAPTT